MDINTIIDTFVLSETQKTDSSSATTTTTTRASSTATGTGGRAIDEKKKKKRVTMTNATKKDKQVKNDKDDDYQVYDVEDADDDDEDVEKDDTPCKKKAGDKRKSTMQRQSQTTLRRQSNRHSIRPYSTAASASTSVAIAGRKSTAAAVATATVDLSVLKMKHLKAVRRHTRVDMLGIGIGYEPDTDDACYEIEEMYATQKDMRRQSTRQSVKPKRRDD